VASLATPKNRLWSHNFWDKLTIMIMIAMISIRFMTSSMQQRSVDYCSAYHFHTTISKVADAVSNRSLHNAKHDACRYLSRNNTYTPSHTHRQSYLLLEWTVLTKINTFVIASKRCARRILNTGTETKHNEFSRRRKFGTLVFPSFGRMTRLRAVVEYTGTATYAHA